MEQRKKYKASAKGDRLHWPLLKTVKPIKLTDLHIKGRKIPSVELAQPSDNINLLIP